MENNMEEKKNNQVQALDDDALENVAGGISYPDDQKRCWVCRNCGTRWIARSAEKCKRCGSSNLSLGKWKT